MINNPLMREGLNGLFGIAFRRIYGISLLLMGGAFFQILPFKGPGGGTGFGGPPPIFVSMGIVSAIITVSALVVSLNIITGRTAEVDQWSGHISPVSFTVGKSAASLIISILYGILPLPFLVLAAHFEALPLSGAPAAALYLTGIILSYTFLLEILELIFGGYPVIRRIILWIAFLFHLLITPGFAPGFNPVLSLSALNQSLEEIPVTSVFLLSFRTGWLLLLLLIPLFVILVFFRIRRESSHE